MSRPKWRDIPAITCLKQKKRRLAQSFCPGHPRGQGYPDDVWAPDVPGLSCPKFGKSKRGLTNGGLSPKFLEKIGQKSFRENRAFSGLIGAFSGPIGAFSGLIGTDYSAPHSRGEAAKVPPKGPFWAQLAPFGLSPRLLSLRLDFPNKNFIFRLFFGPDSEGLLRPKNPRSLGKKDCFEEWRVKL